MDGVAAGSARYPGWWMEQRVIIDDGDGPFAAVEHGVVVAAQQHQVGQCGQMVGVAPLGGDRAAGRGATAVALVQGSADPPRHDPTPAADIQGLAFPTEYDRGQPGVAEGCVSGWGPWSGRAGSLSHYSISCPSRPPTFLAVQQETGPIGVVVLLYCQEHRR